MDKSEAAKFAEILQAWVNGETIQRRKKATDPWTDVPEGSEIILDKEKYYRVKPQSSSSRPYKNSKELLDALEKHGNYLINRYDSEFVSSPVLLKGGKVYMKGTIKSSDGTSVVKTFDYTYKELLDHWTHQDGTVCGIQKTK